MRRALCWSMCEVFWRNIKVSKWIRCLMANLWRVINARVKASTPETVNSFAHPICRSGISNALSNPPWQQYRFYKQLSDLHTYTQYTHTSSAPTSKWQEVNIPYPPIVLPLARHHETDTEPICVQMHLTKPMRSVLDFVSFFKATIGICLSIKKLVTIVMPKMCGHRVRWKENSPVVSLRRKMRLRVRVRPQRNLQKKKEVICTLRSDVWVFFAVVLGDIFAFSNISEVPSRSRPYNNHSHPACAFSLVQFNIQYNFIYNVCS